MNLPNKLTMFRVILIPFFIVFLLVPITPYDKWIALGIFVIASLTDLLDGKIARKYNLEIQSWVTGRSMHLFIYRLTALIPRFTARFSLP